ASSTATVAFFSSILTSSMDGFLLLGRRVQLQLEELDRIVARQPAAPLLRQAVEMIFHDVARIGEGHVEVRVVVRPHAVLLAPPGQRPRADEILEEGAVDMLLEDLARLALDRQLLLEAGALEII